MYQNEPYMSVFEEIINSTKNDIIIFLIVIVIAMILIALPLYVMYTKNKKEERRITLEREDKLMDVITDNTQVITSLKFIIENNVKSTDDLHEVTETLGRTVTEVKVMRNEIINKMTEVYKDSEEIVQSVKDIEIPKIKTIKETNIRIEKHLGEIDDKLDRLQESINNLKK